MAAWLAYLKSRLLLPDTNAPEGQSAEDMANALALRLRRLEAIREAAERLFGRAQLDRDVFARGDPEPIAHIKRPEWSATLYDLLSAYATQRQRHALARLRYAQRTVWSLAEAREALERLVGASEDWSRLDQFLLAYVVEPSMAATVFASSFAATLEMVREGASKCTSRRRSRRSICASVRPRRTRPAMPAARRLPTRARTRGRGGRKPWAWPSGR